MATKAVTIAAMIGDLIETHMQRCDEAFEHEEDRVPHVISEVHGTSANVMEIWNFSDGDGSESLKLELDDGSVFHVRVEEA